MERLLLTLLAPLGLALCACSGNNNSTAPLSGEARVVNGIPGSSALNSSIGNVAIANGTAFRQATGINSPIPIGSYNAQFSVSSSGGSNSFTVDNVAIQQDVLTTVFTAGNTTNNNLTGFTALVPLAAPASGQFTAQFVNAALSVSGSASLSFYMLAPGSTLSTSTAPVATLAYGASSQPLSFASGSYELVVTSGGSVLYDSASSGVQFPPAGGDVLQVAGLDNLPPGYLGCPLFVIVLDNQGNQSNPGNDRVCPA
jgi:hypothetical protein